MKVNKETLVLGIAGGIGGVLGYTLLPRIITRQAAGAFIGAVAGVLLASEVTKK